MAQRTARVGIIGLGFVGGALYRRLLDGAVAGLEVGFVYDRQRDRVAAVASEHAVSTLDELESVRVDLVVECAGPGVTVAHGRSLLARWDYMPLSVTAPADDRLLAELLATARSAGTRLLVPHGALAGMDALCERRDRWREITITFRKPPRHIDGIGGEVDGAMVLYDGPVRGIASRYPRNVNAMVGCALATIGLDRCRAVLVADPDLKELIAEVRAVASDGSMLEIVKRQPGVGVSGTEMPDAILRSVVLATATADGLVFV
jgi:predicted dinucleotide-utilizing enzyme